MSDPSAQDPFLDYLIRLRRVTGGDKLLLSAFEQVPRELFLPHYAREQAYDDTIWPLPLGQTTTRPMLIAQMLKALDVQPHHKVLEIGTGSGYCTALLAYMAGQVCTVERFRSISQQAKSVVSIVRPEPSTQFFIQDGAIGLQSQAPYDRIISWCCLPSLPKDWNAQLTNNGKIVTWVQSSKESARLILFSKLTNETELLPVISESLSNILPKRARLL